MTGEEMERAIKFLLQNQATLEECFSLTKIFRLIFQSIFLMLVAAGEPPAPSQARSAASPGALQLVNLLS